MIKATRLNGKEFYINTDLIEFVESTPDTVITMTTGKKVVVQENVDEIINRIYDYKRRILKGAYE
jgi:flagellar protein FlbD